MTTVKVVLLKPSKYGVDGYVERFENGFMPNATLYHMAGLTPDYINSVKIITNTIDEYVRDDLEYLKQLRPDPDYITLVAIVGVQSHQFHRALDLAALAYDNGLRHCVIGGPHPMTCDTSQFQNRGISFSLAEAEVVWNEILSDAISGELKPVYGQNNRWAANLDGPIVTPPNKQDFEHYLLPSLGLYPARGCPYKCNYCSVIKISGRKIRSTPIDCTLESIMNAKNAGIEYIMFVSDNFNKYPEATLLLEQMIERELNIPFFCQCDAEIHRQPEFVDLLGRAGCYEMFIGVESFDRNILRQAHKFHNKPDNYDKIITYCKKSGIQSNFSNIIGFPSDTEKSIYEQLGIIQLLGPSLSSFYILTPIPGTEQYEEFRTNNLLVEDNIDRYDATCLTWKHPNLTAGELSNLLYRCYIDFYTGILKSGNLSEADTVTALTIRHLAKQNMHPLSGGIGKMQLDHIDDYISLRRQYFDVNLAPMPDCLDLPNLDKQINKARFLPER